MKLDIIFYGIFQINLLKKQVNELKILIAVASGQLNDHLKLASIRAKRQTSDGGDNLPVFDRAYGVDLDLKVIKYRIAFKYDSICTKIRYFSILFCILYKKMMIISFQSNLHHYPYGYQKWRSSTPSSIDPNYSQQQQKVGVQNQNNQYNSNPSYQQDSNRKSQSAYAKVRNFTFSNIVEANSCYQSSSTY